MRLIDADEFIKDLGDGKGIAIDNVRKMVDFYPTAYDVDKVVERLEEKAEAYDDPASSDNGFRRYCRGIAAGYRYAADIVKAGGEDE